MKFRFCGNSDCPDWVLATINNLSKLSSVKLKLLGQIVAEGIIEPPLNIEKAVKLFAESKLDSDKELKACIASLRFIIFSTCKFQCETSAMLSELQQLGLPREHSSAIKKVIDDKHDSITHKLKTSGLKVNALESLSAKVDKESNCAMLDIEINGERKQCTLTEHTVNVLLKELKDLRPKMEELRGYNEKLSNIQSII